MRPTVFLILLLAGCVTIDVPAEEQPFPTELQLQVPDKDQEVIEAARDGQFLRVA